jgi:uncharacterized membrane protein
MAPTRGRVAALSASSVGSLTRPLLLVGVALGLWALRASVAGPRNSWILWNLTLAVCPWLLACVVAARRWSTVSFVLLASAWLAFFPNAPYLVTDFIHLRARPPVPLWLDVLGYSAFALAGLALGAASMVVIEDEVRARWGRAAAWVMVPVVLLLSAWGVFLGRFQRWNSWDVLVRPAEVLARSLEALGDREALTFTVAFAALQAGLYLAARPSRASVPAATSSGRLSR